MTTDLLPSLSLSHAMQLHALFLKFNYNLNPTTSSHSPFLCSAAAHLHLHHQHPLKDASFAAASNTIIRSYARSQCPEAAIRFYIDLQEHGSLGPADGQLTFPFLFSSCARLSAASEGQQLHAIAHKTGLSAAHRYVQNSLIHMYCSCQLLDSANKVFDRMPQRDVVSWTSMIDGAVETNSPVYALWLFDLMQRDGGVSPNEATIVSVLRACAVVGALSIGRRVHQIARERGLDSRPNVATSLIDMYAKCGCIASAEKIFDQMVDRDVFVWTAMVSGLASHGRCEDALGLYHRMVEMGVKPNDRTITAALCACRSSGWVAVGYRIYNYMHRNGLRPRIQHYGCMVDLLARAGHLDEAEGFLRRMPVEPDSIMWRSLIWASRLHKDFNRAERLVKEWKDLKTNVTDGGSYALIGNLYASVGKWEKKARVRELMAHRRIAKLPGHSRIEVKGVIHEFVAGDSSHPEAEKVYRQCDEIVEKLRLQGYSPKASEVLLDMDDEEKFSQLHHHSERLAVAYGLISTEPGEKILVVKNLRSCEDCHTVMKLVSKIYDREILIRDRIRFHHFVNGSCSCKDYW